jgi:Sigma-70 region 2
MFHRQQAVTFLPFLGYRNWGATRMLGAPLGAGDGKAKGLLPLCLPAAEHATPGVPFMVPQAIIQQESVTDDALMSRVRDGDVQALAPLFDRHHASLLNFYLHTTDNRASSEDLLQDVFVRILKYRRTYRPGSRFLTWMYRIARHARVDYIRKRHGEIEWDDAYAAPILPGDPAELTQHRCWLGLAAHITLPVVTIGVFRLKTTAPVVDR